jgi:putative nucleotidyltransferase with HDIG domain
MLNQARQLLLNSDADTLPSLPHVLLQLLDACNNENISFRQIADIIRNDPALLLRVIAAGSDVYDGTEALDRLLSRRSLSTINSIAITTSVQQFFSRRRTTRFAFLKHHWRHSISCARIAESIARSIAYHQPESAYVAGLLHDIGQLVLEHAHSDNYTAAYSSSDDHAAIESQQFETRHDIVGAELLHRHHSSPILADAVRYHHEPVERILDAHPLVRIVNLANRLSHESVGNISDTTLSYADTLFSIQRSELNDILKQSHIDMAETAARFDIDVSIAGSTDAGDRATTANDEHKQLQLAEQVRNIAMIDAVHQYLVRTDGEPALLAAIRQNISILFGIDNCILFLYQPGTDRVRATALNVKEAYFSDIEIPLEPGRSLVTDSLLQQKPVNSFDIEQDELSVIDRQLIGLNAHEGLLCLPMIVNNAAIGTLVLGIDNARLPQLLKQHSLLKRFTNVIAGTLGSAHTENSVVEQNTNEGSLLRTRIREVAHEVRNPLSIINNYLDILGFKLDSDSPAQKDLETIKTEIIRIGDILDKLNEPSTSDTRETSLVNVNALIADLSHVFQTSLFAANNISISLDLDDTLPPVYSNPNALRQIYTNLVKNAVEALPANGHLMVYTQDQVNVDGKAHFEISVADDGPGIDPGILPKLFSPVQTKKGENHAGLGLTIVKNLVNELQGSISCRSSDKGTGFYILLPRNLQEQE